MSEIYEFDKEELGMGDRVSDDDWGDFLSTHCGMLDELIKDYFVKHYERFLDDWEEEVEE